MIKAKKDDLIINLEQTGYQVHINPEVPLEDLNDWTEWAEGYGDQIYRHLRSDYQPNLHNAVLRFLEANGWEILEQSTPFGEFIYDPDADY